MGSLYTVVKNIPTTTVPLISCVVGIPLLKIEYQQQSYFKNAMGGMIVVGILFLLIFVFINSRIPTTHQVNIIVVVGIPFTTVLV